MVDPQGSPFDIIEYRDTALEVTQAAVTLERLVATLESWIRSTKCPTSADGKQARGAFSASR